MNEGSRNQKDRHDRPMGFVRRHGFVLLLITLVFFLLLVPIAHQIREALAPGTAPVLEGIVFIAVLAAAVISLS
jgi:asparagine N-glycosylation enzyme membrane subunit Stt3